MDVKQYSDTLNRDHPPSIVFRRPIDDGDRKFFTYIQKDEGGNDRLRLYIATHEKSTISSMMGSIVKRRPINIVKKIHRFTHLNATEMERLLKDAGHAGGDYTEACNRVYEACEICASEGRPAHSRKVSLSHVNEAFNQEIQADFMMAYIGPDKYIVLNIIDLGTGYGEREIVPSRNAKTMQDKMETLWLLRHGAPKRFSADPEFCQPVLRKFLEAHDIYLADRPSRSSSKNGVVERSNGVFKTVFKKLSRETTTAPPQTIVARASLVTNLLKGSSTMSAFQLARGYSPSIVGAPSSKVTDELLQAHTEMAASRAIQRTLRSRAPRTVPPSALRPGRGVYVFYKTSQQNVPVRWVSAKVVEAKRHYVLCRRSNKGAPMKVAYEHVRLQPTGPLTRQIAEGIMEDELPHINISDELEEEDELLPHEKQVMKDIFGSDHESEEEEEIDRTSFFSGHEPVGEALMDIGQEVAEGPKAAGQELVSSEQHVLREVHGVLKGSQVTRRQMECAPEWLIEQANDREVDDNWKDAYIPVDERTIPRDANIIDSHFVYKVKVNEDNTLKLKARLCPHGNRDRMKGKIRNDSANARFDVIRLLLSVTAILGFRLGCADIKGAYLQSGPIERTLYVRPPRERRNKGELWKLVKLPYGISEAGRQWAKTFESWLLKEAGYERIHGVSQMFVKRDGNADIILMLAKVTDDVLFSGRRSHMETFVKQLKERFEVSKIIVDSDIMFNGSRIMQDHEGNITIDMTEYLSNIEPIEIPEHRRKLLYEKATQEEITGLKGLAGELVWVGYGALPQAAVAASYIQQNIPRSTVENLVGANKTLKEMKDLRPSLVYLSPAEPVVSESVTTFSDAAFNISAHQSYGQTGIITGVSMELQSGGNIYHIIDWTSSKQRRVSHSSYGAEIIACSEADDRGFNVRQSLQSISPDDDIPHHLIVDSKGLYDTISTLHEGRDYRLKQTVQRIRDSFESGDIGVLRWVEGKANLADALTKRNPEMHRLLNRISNEGSIRLPRHRKFQLHSKTWK